MEWTTLASLAARAGKQSYDQRHTIQQYFTKAKAYLDLGQTQIVVTGASGAGKSVLVAQMHGRARDLYYEAPPQSTKVEVEAIALEPWSKLVRVLPGQGARRTDEEIDSLDENDQLEGVIHVVDFGYVAPRDTLAARSLLERNGLDTVAKLRAFNLESEVKALDALLFAVNRALTRHKRPKWLLVAVNKVDLYWNEQDQALAAYHPTGASDFGRALAGFENRVGSQNFGIHVAPSCAYEVDFTWNGHVVPSSLPRQRQNSILRELTGVVARLSEIYA